MKKLLALVLALVMTLGLATVGSNAAFKDAEAIQYDEAVGVMSAIGVLAGMEDGSFQPNGTLTREQGAKIITYMLLGKAAADALSVSKAPFTDVAADRWSAGSIAYCVANGIIAGKGDGTFDPTGTLTGFAFAKMALAALGYDAAIEGLVGSDWELNTAKLVRNLDLDDGIDAFVGSQPITRETAAQVGLNTLKQNEVYYSTTNSIDSDGKSSVGTNTRAQAVLDTNYNPVTLMSDVFPKLENTEPLDDYGRPASKWTLAGVEIGTYAKTAKHVYTKFMNNDSGKKALKAELGDYDYSDVAENNSNDIAALTRNGKIVEVYVKDNAITDVVEILPILVKVTKVESDKITLNTTGDVEEVKDDDDAWDLFKGVKKNDYMIVVEGDNEILEAYAPTKASGELTKIADGDDNNKVKYTIGGNAYGLSFVEGSSFIGIGVGDTCTVSLDKYGYVVRVEEEVSNDAYAFVLDTTENVSKGVYDWSAKLLFADGTMKWVDIAKIGDDKVEDCGSNDLNNMREYFVTYTEDGGKYNIDFDPADTVDADPAVIEKNSTTADFDGTPYTVTTKTVFLVKNSDKTYNVYKGIKNVPNLDDASAWGQNDGGVLSFVVIDDAATSTDDQIFFYTPTPKAQFKSSGDYIYTYKAIVNGEDTTVDVFNVDALAINELGLYFSNDYNNKGYLRTFGDSALNEIVVQAGQDDCWMKATVGGDHWQNVTLKDDVLKVTMGGADVALVVADSFKTWQVDINAVAEKYNVQEITLDDEDTVNELTVYGGAPAGKWKAPWNPGDEDYIVLHVDDDGFVTDLYVVNITPVPAP